MDYKELLKKYITVVRRQSKVFNEMAGIPNQGGDFLGVATFVNMEELGINEIELGILRELSDQVEKERKVDGIQQ